MASDKPPGSAPLIPLEVLKWAGSLLALPATFYAVGYLAIHAYVSTTRLMAAFWFTESFYREAGAAFLIDTLLSMALLPHVFLALSALLVALFPGDLRGHGRHLGYGGFHVRFSLVIDPVLRRRVFYAAVALGVLLTVAILRDKDRFGSQLNDLANSLLTGHLVLGGRTMASWIARRPNLPASALFFAVALPTWVALGSLALRVLLAEFPAGNAPVERMPHQAHPIAALLLACAFAVLTVFVPVAYGARFFDLDVVPLADQARCLDPGTEHAPGNAAAQAAPAASAKVAAHARAPAKAPAPRPLSPTAVSSGCYLLARFDTRYILIGQEVRTNPAGLMATPQILYIKQVVGTGGLEPFSILPYQALTLRSLAYED